MTSSGKKKGDVLSRPIFWAAALAMLGWAAFTVVMITKAPSKGIDGEILWTRLAWLFSSVEAVAFAAAGALFGSSVQRERAEVAEERASEYATDAINGKALASSIVADESEEVARAQDGIESYGPTGRTDSVMAARHAALARKLFPSLSGD